MVEITIKNSTVLVTMFTNLDNNNAINCFTDASTDI